MDEQTIRRGHTTAETLAERAQPPGVVQVGTRYGRYQIVERVGMGGMGVVYAAWDPDVERRVALKLLWPGSESSRAAMLGREARAMARLSDPNVVQVFDVGTDHGQVWVAMEFIEGCSLETWLTERPRPWNEVLDVYMRAGSGLAAAHRAGVIHRDFKPSNVMLAIEEPDARVGRVLVADFGLARAQQDDWSSGRAEATEVSDVDLQASQHPVSRTGAVAGTPAYMAPEQHEGSDVDEGADQFAFCVAVYEGLYGCRPFQGQTVALLASQKMTHRVAEPPASSPVPRRILAILQRGLQPSAHDRWPRMDALLTELKAAAAPGTRRGRWALVSAAAVATAGAVAWTLPDNDAQCSAASERAETVWNDTRAAAVEHGFGRSELVYASDSWTRIRPQVDEYIATWNEEHDRACRSVAAGHGSPESARNDGPVADAVLECLDQNLAHLDALLGVFESGEAATVERAVEAVAGLPAASRCQDRASRHLEPPPAAEAARVQTLRTQLAGVSALYDAGRYAQGRATATELLADAEALGYPPVRAEASLTLARLESADGDSPGAEQHLQQALWTASEIGHDEIAAEAAIELVGLASFLGRHDEALEWARHAEAALQRIGDPPSLRAELLGEESTVYREIGEYDRARSLLEQTRPLLEGATLQPDHAGLENALGNVAFAQGRYEDAIDHHQRALELYKQLLGPDHPQVARALNGLGLASQMRGDFTQARNYHERAMLLRERALGTEHPDFAESLTNLGALSWEEGKLDEAREHYERALAIKESTYGADHIRLAAVLQNLGALELSQSKPQAALDRFTRSLAITEAAYGAEHPQVATALSNLGVTWSRMGDYPRAAEHYRRAFEIEKTALGLDHPGIAVTRQNLGYVLFELGDPEAALEHHRAALSSFLETVGATHRGTTQARIGLAKALAATGSADEAIPLLEAAAHDYPDQESVLQGDIQFELAKIAANEPGGAGRAIELAQHALRHYDAHGHETERAEVTHWLDRLKRAN